MLKISVKTTRTDTGRLVDKVEFPIACPQCGYETQQSVARLQADPTITCPSCSHQFKIESGGTARQVANELNDLDRAFDDLCK